MSLGDGLEALNRLDAKTIAMFVRVDNRFASQDIRLAELDDRLARLEAAASTGPNATIDDEAISAAESRRKPNDKQEGQG